MAALFALSIWARFRDAVGMLRLRGEDRFALLTASLCMTVVMNT
jgi:hypothetical protein